MTALGVLCCFALFVCLTLLASFFVPSHLSFKHVYNIRISRGNSTAASHVYNIHVHMYFSVLITHVHMYFSVLITPLLTQGGSGGGEGQWKQACMCTSTATIHVTSTANFTCTQVSCVIND